MLLVPVFVKDSMAKILMTLLFSSLTMTGEMRGPLQIRIPSCLTGKCKDLQRDFSQMHICQWLLTWSTDFNRTFPSCPVADINLALPLL